MTDDEAGEFIGTCLECGVPVYESDDYGRDTDGNVYCVDCTGDVPF